MKFKRFLSNTHDPADPQCHIYIARSFYETEQEAWEHHCDWLKDKIIGQPKATKHYSVKELKKQKTVGVYEMMSLKRFLAHVWLCFKIEFKIKFKIYPYNKRYLYFTENKLNERK